MKKGHGNKYDPLKVLEEFQGYLRDDFYKKQAYYLLSKKYNKSMAHIRRIVRQVKQAE